MAMVDMFLKGIGFDPTEFAQACEHYKREFEGMKAGLQHAVQHFNTQLETVKTNQVAVNDYVLKLERKIDDIDVKLDAITIAFQFLKPSTSPETKPNGHDHNGH